MWALGAMTREEALAGLGQAERGTLLAALEKIRANLSERGALRVATEPETSAETAPQRRSASHG